MTDVDNVNKALIEQINSLRGALRFILAFYEPGQRHLDTNAWKVAEAAARHCMAETSDLAAALTVALEQAKVDGIEAAAQIVQRSLDHQDGEAIKVSGDLRRWEKHHYAANFLQLVVLKQIRGLISPK